MILHIARGDKRGTVAHATGEMGLVTKHKREDVIYRLLCFFHDRDTDDVTGGRNIQAFMDWANAEDPILELDDNYVMVGRVALLLRGLGNAFNLKLRVSQYVRSLLSLPISLSVREVKLGDQEGRERVGRMTKRD